ncbi:metallophosphoesterase family protein [Hymenobacter arizonensis]|uniref:Calcineurin-like phosphoesterase n=1 Tax=Hymenobacter arizonensis TaxID=1227077 RepID=A0A1I6AIW7_HYMAR|nr:metallophosphoesterase [Hymenobacter arizonensis]SFQ68603.1 Calcineurin-like phosphoesterase [Hymenobacter arizonensis]
MKNPFSLPSVRRRWGGWAAGLAALVLLTSCELFEFSPNQTHTPEAYRDLTRKNLEALLARPNPLGDDSLRFVFISDSQRFYDEAAAFVRSVNQQPGVAFVALGGDVSDFGLVREMRWVHDRLRHLNVPYLTVIGNHDHVANGRQAYQNVYGPLNYSFTYAGTRFICLDTNGREYGFNGRVPDVDWLRAQLADSAGVTQQVVLCHVPPEDADFDPQLQAPYVQALGEAPMLALHLNGHRHSFGISNPFELHVPFINSYGFEKRQYVMLTMGRTGGFRLQTVPY